MLACAALFAVALAQSAPVELRRDVEFARPGGVALAMDIALPGGTAAENDRSLRPAVLFLHGGGWSQGNRAMYHGMVREAARRGWVGATASYRLAPKHRWPAQGEDAAAALTFLQQSAEELRVDPARIF